MQRLGTGERESLEAVRVRFENGGERLAQDGLVALRRHSQERSDRRVLMVGRHADADVPVPIEHPVEERCELAVSSGAFRAALRKQVRIPTALAYGSDVSGVDGGASGNAKSLANPLTNCSTPGEELHMLEPASATAVEQQDEIVRVPVGVPHRVRGTVQADRAGRSIERHLGWRKAPVAAPFGRLLRNDRGALVLAIAERLELMHGVRIQSRPRRLLVALA